MEELSSVFIVGLGSEQGKTTTVEFLLCFLQKFLSFRCVINIHCSVRSLLPTSQSKRHFFSSPLSNNLINRFLTFAASSAAPCHLDPDPHDPDLPYGFGAPEHDQTVKIPVKAYFLSTRFAFKFLNFCSCFDYHVICAKGSLP